MTTEIIGYIGQHQTVQKPTEIHTEPRKTIKIHIINKVKARLLGTLMIVLGTISIPVCENDATAFVMCLILGIAAIIGGNNNE